MQKQVVVEDVEENWKIFNEGLLKCAKRVRVLEGDVNGGTDQWRMRLPNKRGRTSCGCENVEVCRDGSKESGTVSKRGQMRGGKTAVWKF